ncbi:tumor necrosis factor receptor superfamily member 5 [Centroberyx gerrardi]
MAKLDCKRDEYLSQDGQRCCDRCPAGKYIRSDCDGTEKTKCDECGRGFHTATKNHLYVCQACRVCHRSNNHKKVKECPADEDTQCECIPGFYCNEPDCEHCKPVTHCPVGEGVKAKATRMNDTICAPCETGSFSNASDFHSSCQPHKSCEDWGRVLETPGTPSADAVCGRFKSQCPWILPASLWSGLALTSLILLFIIYWRAKRKSYKTACSSDPDVTVKPVPAAYICPVELPLPSIEYNGHCQESCEKSCVSPLFDPDDKVVICCTQDSVESSLPITPLTASAQFGESNHINGNAGNCTRNSLRTHSEPQEDEWCGM